MPERKTRVGKKKEGRKRELQEETTEKDLMYLALAARLGGGSNGGRNFGFGFLRHVCEEM